MSKQTLHLVYNGITQTFALFVDAADAKAFRDYMSDCGHMVGLKEVEIYGDAESAMKCFSPADIVTNHLAGVPHEPPKPRTGSVLRALDFAEVVNEVQKAQED